jgi:hypothetical protein
MGRSSGRCSKKYLKYTAHLVVKVLVRPGVKCTPAPVAAAVAVAVVALPVATTAVPVGVFATTEGADG